MDSKARMSVRHALIPLALLGVLAAAASCGDPSPMGVAAFQKTDGGAPTLIPVSGLVSCPQKYEIGRASCRERV